MRLKSFNVSGDGSTHTIASATGGAVTMCKWFQFLNVDAAICNVGGSDVDDTHGYPISATGANFQPPEAQSMEFYDLTQCYYRLSNAAHGVILCAL